MNKILKFPPFELPQKKRRDIFLNSIIESAKWHYKNSKEFKNLCLNRNFNPYSSFSIENLPYIHVSLFKKLQLLSVPKIKIIKTLLSSSTSGIPSKVFIDKETSENQRIALQKILGDFFGKKRKPFVIFDTDKTTSGKGKELLSRATAIRGFLSMSKSFQFILNEKLEMDSSKTNKLNPADYQNGVVFFGFTWLIYSILKKLKDNGAADFFKKIDGNHSYLIHIGGWKKLQDLGVTKGNLNQLVSKTLALPQKNIIDVYGMTEQLGTIYPDCKYGHKHLPLYSEIIVRDTESLKPLDTDKIGFIQLISPLPVSYPGISILSDDLGKTLGIDNCPCGRKGKYFIFVKRSDRAEVRGCGDTLNI